MGVCQARNPHYWKNLFTVKFNFCYFWNVSDQHNADQKNIFLKYTFAIHFLGNDVIFRKYCNYLA